jgi:hypothetical protein
MLETMRKATILISILAFSVFGLLAQDDLATFQTMMKAAAGANGAARGAADQAALSAKAKEAAENFDKIAAYFKEKGKDDGVKFAMAASEVYKTAGSAATLEEGKAALGKVGPNCQGCHAVYRDGSKFKGM